MQANLEAEMQTQEYDRQLEEAKKYETPQFKIE